MNSLKGRYTSKVIGTHIDAVDWHGACDIIFSWSSRRESRYVCICNVHSVVTGVYDQSFANVLNQADMATPDGAPIAWMMRRLGHPKQARINGPDLMWLCCREAALKEQKVFLYGSSENTLARLVLNLQDRFPNLQIAGAISPPYRVLNDKEDASMVDAINMSGAQIVFVSLGCPKQELWMARHRGRINAVMVGVGAAFDYHAGTVRRAPEWMQNYGLEWFYRLATEPRRLWKRYLVSNTLFIGIAAKQLIFRDRA